MPLKVVDSVRTASANKVQGRFQAIASVFAEYDSARRQAAATKEYVLDNLADLLVELEASCLKNGVQVHWAEDAEQANRLILGIVSRAAPSALVVKGKSMATEEIGLNERLIQEGHQVVETDLGEFVVQLDDDVPSHIVTPIIHKDRTDVKRTFESHGLSPRSDEPEELAAVARARLREEFRRADVGISGVNFAVASSGRLVIVENEGNNRLSTTAPRVHIAVMGLEKVLPCDTDLALFLRLLAASSTGQRLTVYTHLVCGPRRPDEPDGPEEVHLVLLDNGRSKILNGALREILKCLRCGACLNVCPVYRQASGHTYRHTYSGPLGAVLAPGLDGVHSHGALAFASTLCGACQEVCPVDIPIPELLLKIRAEVGATPAAPWPVWAWFAQRSARWRMALKALPMVEPLARPWTEHREWPEPSGVDFRRWWDQRP
ncbi:MAG: lactate utilization protein [Fimbriimonadaceae bacterium]|nr:lactate utilization protein [Fimbriimonadaceae bacterium]QYK57501.1 MAG: lactate utilization protein [Fimbriimonadaceae bacterium]